MCREPKIYRFLQGYTGAAQGSQRAVQGRRGHTGAVQAGLYRVVQCHGVCMGPVYVAQELWGQMFKAKGTANHLQAPYCVCMDAGCVLSWGLYTHLSMNQNCSILCYCILAIVVLYMC